MKYPRHLPCDLILVHAHELRDRGVIATLNLLLAALQRSGQQVRHVLEIKVGNSVPGSAF